MSWNDKHLEQRRKGDGEKVKMAQRLRCETTMTLAWIAERQAMEHWRTASNAVTLPEKMSIPLVISDPFMTRLQRTQSRIAGASKLRP